MATAPIFTRHILSSFPTLQAFVTNNHAVNKITAWQSFPCFAAKFSAIKSSFTVPSYRYTDPYDNPLGWVCNLIARICRAVSRFFTWCHQKVRASRFLASATETLSNCFKEWHEKTKTPTLPPVSFSCLSITKNAPNTEGAYVATHPKIPVSFLDPKVARKLLLDKHGSPKKEIEFKSEGYCYGMSQLFLRYYLLTKGAFAFNPRLQMQALGLYFFKGAPPEAVVLQTFQLIRGGKMLGVRVGEGSKKWDHHVCEWRYGNIPEDITTKLASVANGAYRISINDGGVGHSIAYVKAEGKGFVFDPNIGIIEIGGDQGRGLLKMLICSWGKKRPPKCVKISPPYTLRT
ncbi:MAG: hypothetical protein JSR76_00180 [Verrucomicrobia bacterium]|nr:hypothetical protein [Verrucomicrobiota bacterium]